MLTWFSSLKSPMSTSPRGVRCGSILARMDAPRVLTATVEGGRLTDHDRRSLPVPWWSLTKTAIAAAALALVGDGRLALDEALHSRPYTLRQLLQHTAGVPEYGALAAYHEAVCRRDEPWSVEELLRGVVADRPLFAPGVDSPTRTSAISSRGA